ncbi:hypothetical protein EPD60_03930 [Flaviaesturariibacter flavus]|uniref:DUF4846 domain-containing protein n=1 Tax=Flaviaesturariibacter flavus TaxID=2502780 RepID=A0A4R1BMV4_9BACT|nr:DUF4846 domain-containing protein [Flaviaesturariibacter flavus]TCJ18658.1 hypothetical protein EPD60_03930 [Flaviaesturariibacter flavus]
MPALFVSFVPGTLLFLLTGLTTAGGQQPRFSPQQKTVYATIAPSENTVATRFPPPEGFRRLPVAPGSFAGYLRGLPLKPYGAAVHYFDGRTKPRTVHVAVIDLDVGTRDLQQCADAVMRLRAEWLYAQGRKSEIAFRLTDGRLVAYSNWMQGKRLRVRGNSSSWFAGAPAGDTYASFRQYLDFVFTYAGTLSLEKSLRPKPAADISIGDVFIRGGSPGHAVIVLDVVVNSRGERRFLLAQSYMPAQEIHILKNEAAPEWSPWYSNRIGKILETPEWDFAAEELRTW